MSSLLSLITVLVVIQFRAVFSNHNAEFNLPSDKEWMSLTQSVDFIPASNHENNPLLRRAQNRLLNYYKEEFVDGLETQYNDYAQVWRYLGVFMDCTYNAQNNKRRQLDENAEDEAAEEEEVEEEELEEEEEEVDDGSVCKRYLLWAAYADLNYEGNGLSEYMLYNGKTKSWDKTACKAGNSKRCVKMDCHQANSHFKPLGYFRQDSPVEFLTLIAKYQGSCSFTDGEANAVADGLEWLPQQCTQTQLSDGNYIYFDLKPKKYGAVDVGLYTNAKCSLEYSGSETPQSVLTTYYGFDVGLEENMKNINAALDTFKICTPCRTFDLSYTPAAVEEGAEEQAEAVDDVNDMNFICTDDAGNAGVNQCAMMAKNSDISAATMSEIRLASQQGSISRLYASAEGKESWWEAWGFFFMSVLVFLMGLLCFCSIAVKRKRVSSSLSNNRNEPLLARQ